MPRRSMSHALSVAHTLARAVAKASKTVSPRSRKGRPGHGREGQGGKNHRVSGYAGDYVGVPAMTYAPVADSLPDPGEVVWTWVPYEEDHRRGKDRPVLVIGRHQGLLLALQLTSQDHDRDAEEEARHGRYWIDIGTGEWDRERRPSEARVDRILQLDPSEVRRIGAVLSESI
ncbi:MAG: type II toxin-antitoxin system PemK/MazF family toxin, partial [Ornithinimicrobium sp.]